MTLERQAVHTVFGGAHLFRAAVVERFRALALQSLDEFAPDAVTLASVFGFASGAHAELVFARLREKLIREPIEDYRIDFEDGYGVRADSEEDGHAAAAAHEVAAALAGGSLPWRIGIRVKAMNGTERARSVRTLRLFLSTLIGAAGQLPPNFVVTVPKVMDPGQVGDFAAILAALERELGLASRTLRFEVMIETPQIVLSADGRSPLPLLVEAGGGRLSAAIFGAYDYTAPLGITAAHQSLRHPACDLARQMMLLAFAGSNVRVSDGATAVLPVAVHRALEGETLGAAQAAENRQSVHAAWKIHHDNIRHAMVNGFYQGWDLHPAQLVSRYAATFSFFLEGLDAAGVRLKNFAAKAERATRVGAAFDDTATGRGLANSFLLAVSCGAIAQAEAEEKSGMDMHALRALTSLRGTEPG
jgi:hypothetical protein